MNTSVFFRWLLLPLWIAAITAVAEEQEQEHTNHLSPDSDEMAMGDSMMMDHSQHMEMATSSVSTYTDNLVMDFELAGPNQTAATLSDYRGQYVILGFGFTHCEFVCPTMGATMARALKLSNQSAIGIFVSVDTERDSPEIIHEYAQKFHPRLIGLGGSYAQVSMAAANFGVTFAVTKTQRSYAVQHTASLYLIHPNGNLVEIFALNATAEEIAAAMTPQV